MRFAFWFVTSRNGRSAEQEISRLLSREQLLSRLSERCQWSVRRSIGRVVHLQQRSHRAIAGYLLRAREGLMSRCAEDRPY